MMCRRRIKVTSVMGNNNSWRTIFALHFGRIIQIQATSIICLSKKKAETADGVKFEKCKKCSSGVKF